MRYITILICLLGSFSLFAQFDAELEPGDTFAFVNATIMNPDNSPYVGDVTFMGTKPGHQVVTKTNSKGVVKAKVPISDTYTLYCDREQPAFRKARVGDFPFVTSRVRTYTHRFVRFNFTYLNPQGDGVPDEWVQVKSDKTGKIYVDTTNKKGIASFDLPFDPSFTVGVKYFEDAWALQVRDVDKEYKVMSMGITNISSKERARRAHIADSLARIEYKRTYEYLDSMMREGKVDELLKEDIRIPVGMDSVEWVIDLMIKKAELYKEALLKDPKFLEKKRKSVLSTLYRVRNKYKNKIIVTDITGSMYGYMEEVMLWHALNFTQGLSTKYVFFNDGNRTPDGNKKLGKTGGIYFCEGAFKDFKHVLEVMQKGMHAGGGGDTEENDVEALLLATEKRSKVDEVILIADNYSPVRDMALLKKLKMPVRVILCGPERSDDRYSFWVEVNEQYLELARQTGGSVHTLHDDLYSLATIVNGDQITLEGQVYEFRNGQFKLIKKM